FSQLTVCFPGHQWLRTTVDNATSLSNHGTRQYLRLNQEYLNADPYTAFDLMLQATSDLMTALAGQQMTNLSIELDRHHHLVQVPHSAYFDQVVRRELRVPQYDLFDLGRKYVDPTNDQHVVGAARDLIHSTH